MNELTFVHSDLYGEALKIVKGFVPKTSFRPILNYALHTSDGTMWATDSHRLIQIKNIHGYKEETLVHPGSLTIARGGNYPMLQSLLEDGEKHTKVAITLDIEMVKVWAVLFKQIATSMKTLKQHRNFATKLSLVDGGLEIEYLNDKIRMTLPIDSEITPNEFEPITFSADYMKQALEAFIAMKSKSIDIEFASTMRPFILKDNDKVTVMILPVRTYE